jgi:hypothetical protein
VNLSPAGTGAVRHQRCGPTVEHAAFDNRAGDLLTFNGLTQLQKMSLSFPVRLRVGKNCPQRFLESAPLAPLQRFAETSKLRLEPSRDQTAQPAPILHRRSIAEFIRLKHFAHP